MNNNIIKKRLKQIFDLFDIKVLDFEIDKIINMVKTDYWYKLEESKELDDLLNKSCKGMVVFDRKIIFLSSICKNEKDRKRTLIHEKLHAILYEIGIEECHKEELIDRLTNAFFD